MKILSVFEDRRDDRYRGMTFVVTQGCVNDIACYYGPSIQGVSGIASGGEKLTKSQFDRTVGAWNYEADGLHYRR